LIFIGNTFAQEFQKTPHNKTLSARGGTYQVTLKDATRKK